MKKIKSKINYHRFLHPKWGSWVEFVLLLTPLPLFLLHWLFLILSRLLLQFGCTSYIWLLFSYSSSLFPWPIGGAHCWIDLAFSWDPPQVFQTDPLHPFVSLDCSRISLTVSVLSRFLSQALLHVLSPAVCLHQLDCGDSCWT